MAIQFECVSCGKPIEIDAQWALKLVECPYCHDTVTAPAMSTYHERTAIADQPRHVEVPVGTPLYVEAAAVAAAPRNAVAVVAIVLAIVSLVTLISLNIAFATMLMDQVDQNATPEELTEVLQKSLEQGDQGLWLLVFGCMGWFLLWMAAVVCSIVALCRPGRRGMAIGATVLAGIPVLLLCAGLLTG